MARATTRRKQEAGSPRGHPALSTVTSEAGSHLCVPSRARLDHFVYEEFSQANARPCSALGEASYDK